MGAKNGCTKIGNSLTFVGQILKLINAAHHSDENLKETTSWSNLKLRTLRTKHWHNIWREPS